MQIFCLFFVFSISPDHGLIQQIRLVLNDIYSIFPKMISNEIPWTIASPTRFVKKQLKRTISLPLIGGKKLKKIEFTHQIILTMFYFRIQSNKCH